MKQIVGYYVVPPGDLWVRFQDGEMRQATDFEKASVLNYSEVATQIDWHDPQCRQPQTGSVQRFNGAPASH